MSGIYIHIPFCKKKCVYCDFHISTLLRNKENLVSAIIKEIKYRKDLNYQVRTIYFGGGTPSLLSKKDLFQILEEINKNFSVKSTEITLESNPDDINKQYLNELKDIGINRISLGVQSFIDRDLKFMGRGHNSLDSIKAIEEIQNSLTGNMSVDLIYGLPDQSINEWEYNINKTVNLGIKHISSYALTIEDKTELSYLLKKNKVDVKEDTFIDYYNLSIDILEKNGYISYEISNSAKKGFFSEHNSSYWNQKPYLGFGPSAHSFDGDNLRRWNISNNNIYIKKITDNEKYFHEELLSQKDKFNEYIMTGLRTMWGIDINYIENNFKIYYYDIKDKIEELLNRRILYKKDNNIVISRDNMFFSDGIISGLFVL